MSKKAKAKKANSAAVAKPKTKPKAKNPQYAVVPLAANTLQKAKPKSKPKKPNPEAVQLFGRRFSAIELLKVFTGGLVGVAITKLVSARMPADLVGTPFAKVLTSGAIAFGQGYAGIRADAEFGAGMLFGGGMQTVSVALNGFLPELGSRISLQGMGDLVQVDGINVQNPLETRAQLPIDQNGLLTLPATYEQTPYN